MKFLFALFVLFFNLIESYEIKEGYLCSEECKTYYRIAGKGDPVVVIHGGPGLDHTYFLPAMDVLAANHQIIYYDQRGSGKSLSDINCETINMDTFVNDLEELRKHLNLEHFSIIGHSFGSLLAIEYSLKHPKRVTSLVIMNSYPANHYGLECYYEKLGERLKTVSDQLMHIEVSESFKNREPEFVNKYLQLVFPKYFYDENKVLLFSSNFCDVTAKNFFVISAFLDNDYLSEYDLYEQLEQLKMPTLIIHGASDPVPEKCARELHKNIKNSEYILVDGSGHFTFVEQPGLLFKALNPFLIQNSR